jgi:hypothetical protein
MELPYSVEAFPSRWGRQPRAAREQCFNASTATRHSGVGSCCGTDLDLVLGGARVLPLRRVTAKEALDAPHAERGDGGAKRVLH